MKIRLMPMLLLVLMVAGAMPGLAQASRLDAIWARVSTGSPITLDGNLNELGWTKAESVTVRFGIDNGIPGSGWKIESGQLPNDTTVAVLKFLVSGNQLYLGAKVKDRSVGGSKDFNRFDGLLMSLKDHADFNAPKPPAEYFYAWWYAESDDPQPPGQSPAFIGRWGSWPPGTPRTPEAIDAWDAVTVVHGLSNSDATLDTGYTVEMRFDLTVMGYDVTRFEGDIVEWNVSIYDCDWFWPFVPSTFTSYRTWWQSPWGNAAWYSEVRIHARPDVTIFTPVLPAIGPEVHVLNAAAHPAPVIDGVLNETAWGNAWPRFDLRYGDDELRQSYPYVGRYRAGQYQPDVNGGQAAVLDPADATVKMFYRGDKLYLGFDVRDQVVQFHPSFDRWDGFLVSINDRVQRNPDQALLGRRLSFQVGPTGAAVPQDYLLTMVNAGTAEIAITLKPGTVVDTLGIEPDAGYYAELAIDLTALGYPTGLGDGVLFIGVNHLDGDSFIPTSDSYGTRTWWYREYEGNCCPAWAYLDPTFVTSVEPEVVSELAPVTLRNFPNPGARTTIEYALSEGGAVSLEVFDVQGRRVERRSLGVRPAGDGQVEFDGAGRPAGLYLYRIEVTDPQTGALRATRQGRMVILN